MKRRIHLLIAAAMLLSLLAGSALASQQEEVIRWSAPRTATYDKIHPYTLNWSGDVLDRGGPAPRQMEPVGSR